MVKHPILSLLAVAALVSAAGLSAAEPAGPRLMEDDEKIVLENDHVTVWFHGKKPMLKVFPTAAATVDGEDVAGAFGYKFQRIVEYRDVNGDGVPAGTEIVGRLNLEKASAYEIEDVSTEDDVILNLTLVAPVQTGPDVAGDGIDLPDRDAHVSLVFRIARDAFTVDAGNATMEVPATAVKWDLVVETWPWVDATGNRLAIQMIATGVLDVEEGEDGVTRASLSSNATDVGALQWTTTAQGVDSEGESVEVPVLAVVEPTLERDANATENVTKAPESRITFTYDAPDLATLVHDPTIGVASTPDAEEAGEVPDVVGRIREAPAAGGVIVAAAAAVGAVAVAVARRRT